MKDEKREVFLRWSKQSQDKTRLTWMCFQMN